MTVQPYSDKCHPSHSASVLHYRCYITYYNRPAIIRHKWSTAAAAQVLLPARLADDVTQQQHHNKTHNRYNW